MPRLLRRITWRGAHLRRSLFDLIVFRIFRRRGASRSLRRLGSRKRKTPHPIHRLPLELIAHIFLLGSRNDVGFPVTVSHVCSVWRWLALSTPALWTRIALDTRIEMWQERIRRARHHPLSISLITRPYGTRAARLPRRYRYIAEEDYVSVQWYMHSVAPYMYRWRQLHVAFYTYAPYLMAAALGQLGTARAQAPMLEDLSLIYPRNDDPTEFSIFNGVVPHLRRVTLLGVRLAWHPSAFANLSHLDYTHHGFTRGVSAVTEVLSMLQISTRLVHLRITFPASPEDFISMAVPPYRSSLLSLPALRTLRITCHTRDIPVELVHLVAHLHLPALTALFLLDPRRSRRPFQRVHDFVKAFTYGRERADSMMPVTSVQIEDGWFEHRAALALVRALPRVQKLVVEGPRVTDAFMADVAKIRAGRPRRLAGRKASAMSEGRGLDGMTAGKAQSGVQEARSLDALSRVVMNAGSVARRRRASEDRATYGSLRRRLSIR